MLKSTSALFFIGMLMTVVPTWAQKVPGQGGHTPGPYIIPVDYDKLYQLAQPPVYKPFSVYGRFLLGVATQKVPLMANPWMSLPERVTKTADLVYKEVGEKKLRLDIYQPKGDATTKPLILIIHGGYWKTGDKSLHIHNAVEFTDLGYTVAAVNYRHSTEAKFPAAIEDLRDAIVYLTENAGQYNIDPSRITTYGGSAGGHLSAFMGLAANSRGKAYVEGINPEVIKGVISLYGMHDLTLEIQRQHPFTELFIGKPYGQVPETYRDASPVYHVDKKDPPVLLIHGSLDGSVSVQNSDTLSQKLKASGVPVTYDRVEGWPHGMDFFSPVGERSLWHIYQFLKTYMPSDKIKKAS